MPTTPSGGVQLLATGIPGFDPIATGGLPRERVTLVSGTAGAGKTVFATQFLVQGILEAGDACVFVCLEEPSSDIRISMRSLGWDIAGFEAAAKWVFIDGALSARDEEAIVGDYDLGGLLARIQAAIVRIGARRLVIDAVTALFSRFADRAKIRSELFRIGQAIKDMGVTTLMTGERSSDHATVSRYEIEEFVVDNVVILRNGLDDELRRRTLEILKMRGVAHRRGEFPFVITNGRGIEVVPLSAIQLKHRSSLQRTTYGNAELDHMSEVGAFRDSITLVSGPTGVGKTLLASGFAAGGAAVGERCLYLGFEESYEQLFRNAKGWGFDFAELERQGLLRIICEYPEAASLEDRLISIRDVIAEYRPHRLILDTMTALHRLSSERSFRDFTLGLTSLVKREQITGLFTADVGAIINVSEASKDHLSAITDAIILLRYVEIGSRIHRGITVLKMRGTSHDADIREFTIDSSGLHIGPPFLHVQGVLTGSGQLTSRSPSSPRL